MNEIKRYAGIGSRDTPQRVIAQMWRIAKTLGERGYTLRTGGALGADEAFRQGSFGYNLELMLPWSGYNKHYIDNHRHFSGWSESLEAIAAEHHPAWTRCSHGARKLHTRNVAIMIGLDAGNPKPVDFVVCYTKDGKATGGTGQAIRLALHYDIPVFNIFHTEAEEELWDYIGM